MTTRKVIIHVRLSGVHGRNQLNGIFRYLGRTTAWDIRLTQNESELLEELRSSIEESEHPDGFIISAPVSDEACAQIAKLHTPTVLIDIRPYHIPGRNKDLAFVHNDDGGIGLAAAKHLIDLGNFRSFAFIHAKDPRPWSDRRHEAFSCFLSKHEQECSVYPPNNLPSAEDRQSLTRFLQRLKRPTAVFAAWDNRAIQVLECAHAAKINIPDEMVLLGVDDDILCEHTHPPLASVRPDSEQEGYCAAKILNCMFRKRKWAKSTLCKISGISERESASAISPGGHLVRRALEFIEQNKTKPISAVDVVKHLGVSRRLADKCFHKFQHETILSAITRIRMKEIQQRLRNSKLPIVKIANSCGFPDTSYLMTLFRKKFGMTMRQWRQQSRTDPAKDFTS